MPTTRGSLLGVYLSVVGLSLISLFAGSKNLKIISLSVLITSIFLSIWAFQGKKHEENMAEKAQRLYEEKQKAEEQTNIKK